jgi:two-component system, NarL family, nitrate/nitrite response regulator NarL
MTRVLIVASIRLYREGLAQLLTSNADFTVVGTDSTGREAMERVDETTPDVALVDMDIPDLGDISAAFATRSPPIPLVAVGIAESDSEVLACAEMGIAGYVTRESSIAELAAALRGAAGGELFCSPRTAGILIRRVAELAADRHQNQNGSVALLTQREREVATLMCENLSNKEIASRLCIEVATVKNHVHNVLDKLNVHRRTEAVRLLARAANGFARHS